MTGDDDIPCPDPSHYTLPEHGTQPERHHTAPIPMSHEAAAGITLARLEAMDVAIMSMERIQRIYRHPHQAPEWQMIQDMLADHCDALETMVMTATVANDVAAWRMAFRHLERVCRAMRTEVHASVPVPPKV